MCEPPVQGVRTAGAPDTLGPKQTRTEPELTRGLLRVTVEPPAAKGQAPPAAAALKLKAVTSVPCFVLANILQTPLPSLTDHLRPGGCSNQL